MDDIAVGGDVKAKLAISASGTTALSSSSKALILSFQVGADTTSENKIDVALDSMSATSIGVNGIKVTGKDSLNADKAVNTIADAIAKFPRNVPLLVLFRTDLSTRSRTWITL